MSARVVNIVIEQGSTINNTYILEDTTTNSVKNLAGFSAQAKLAKHPASSTKVNFTTSIVSAVGQVGIALTAGVTSALKPGRYVYDVLLTDSSSVKTRVVEGTALVTAGVCT